MPKGLKYEQSFKDEVIKFVQQHNTEHEWGGQTAAIKKYGISGLTIKAWLDKAGVVTPGRGGRRSGSERAPRTKSVVKRARAQKTTGRSSGSGKDLESKLNRMLELRNEIAVLEKEFEHLRKNL